jgi:hypothetical protein
MHDHRASTVGRLLHGVVTGALSGLVCFAARSVRATHRRRLAARSQALPDNLQVWEDEGGQGQMPQMPRR